MGGTEIGTVIAGYRLERLVGRGGMGAVWLASDDRLGRRVALKLLAPDLASDDRFRRRFLSESRLAASLDHPHIVPVYDAGDADGELYIAMRYVDGDTLDDLIRQGPIEPVRALGLLRGVADAIDAAHAAGLVHRDVKPGNILVSRTPSGEHAYLADFGLVKRLGDASLTGTGQIIGSVGYLAPEQVESVAVDGRADVYSLGCVLYAAVTGVAPFARDTDMATLYAHVSTPPPTPSSVRPELAPLDPVIERALAKDPAARFGTAGALMAAATDALRSGTTRGFLFADLRGYTAYVERHGDQAGVVLLDRYRGLTRTVIASHDGAEIRTEGDSFYVVFPSASRALSAALALTDAADQEASAHPERPLAVGVGVHAGETAESAEGPVGSAVNTAARLCAAARPGEVLVSDTVRSLVRTTLPVSFTSRGRRTFKGLAEPVAVYAARRESPDLRGITVRPATGGYSAGGRRALVAALVGAGSLLLAGLLGVGALGLGRVGSSPSSSPSASSAVFAGSDGAAAAAGGAATDWIAYVRRGASPGGRLTCTTAAWEAAPGELRLVRPDGSQDHALAPASDLFAHRPDWSPDGSALAFLGASTDRTAVWSIRPDGSGVDDLIGEPGTDELPGPAAWSADGRIAWIDTSENALGIAEGDGSGRRKVPTGIQEELIDKSGPAPIADLDWLPDGRLGFVVVPTGSTPDDDLTPGVPYTIRADGSGLTQVALPEGLEVDQARWSPDGSRIALTVERGGVSDIVVVDDGGPIDITRTAATDRDPAWSPDGTRLAFASDRSGTYEIYTVSADGGESQAVTRTEDSRASCAPSWGHTAGAVPGPEPSPSPGVVQPLRRGWLPAGSYEASAFDPPFTVELTEGWQTWQVDPDDTWLRFFSGASSADVDVGRIAVGYPDGCLQSPTELAPGNARDLIEWLRSHRGVKVGTPAAVTIGGAPGIQVDVTGVGPPPCDTPPNRIFLFDVANGSVFVRPDETIRLIAIDVGGTLVVIVPRATADGAADETIYRQLVAPVLASMHFEPRP